MSVRQPIQAVTDPIASRNAHSRHKYLDRIEAQMQSGVRRAALSCGNLAHGFATCSATDNASLAGSEALNLPSSRIQ
ncbi:hypothetical protein C8J37_10920 [Rhizobium sp. PP-WC-1G-195]|nr:hypothetical protein C8J37_10920 [Rhizobium sp. PP-WC-1G-195]